MPQIYHEDPKNQTLKTKIHHQEQSYTICSKLTQKAHNTNEKNNKKWKTITECGVEALTPWRWTCNAVRNSGQLFFGWERLWLIHLSSTSSSHLYISLSLSRNQPPRSNETQIQAQPRSQI